MAMLIWKQIQIASFLAELNLILMLSFFSLSLDRVDFEEIDKEKNVKHLEEDTITILRLQKRR
ncbi:hypothetical protein ACSBR2_016526 [Camellia fascicularis]